MARPVLQFQNVSYAYNHDVVFRGITLTIEAGDFAAIIGPNGGGKSTLLKLAVGLLTPHRGHVLLSGADGRPLPGPAIGYVAQNAGRSGHAFPATVYEVAAMGRTPLKKWCSFLNKTDRQIIRHVLESVDMWAYRDRLIGQLSGGQMQRVFVAKALAVNPAVLMMDEPAAGVDMQNRERLYALLAMLRKNLGVTVIVATHDIERILHYAGTVVCVNRGITYHGPAMDFRASTKVLPGEGQVSEREMTANG